MSCHSCLALTGGTSFMVYYSANIWRGHRVGPGLNTSDLGEEEKEERGEEWAFKTVVACQGSVKKQEQLLALQHWGEKFSSSCHLVPLYTSCCFIFFLKGCCSGSNGFLIKQKWMFVATAVAKRKEGKGGHTRQVAMPVTHSLSRVCPPRDGLHVSSSANHKQHVKPPPLPPVFFPVICWKGLLVFLWYSSFKYDAYCWIKTKAIVLKPWVYQNLR